MVHRGTVLATKAGRAPRPASARKDSRGDLSWMDRAQCAGQDVEVFFPRESPSPAEARMLCDGCPVINDCLAHAVTHRLEGVWGGTTWEERTRRPAKKKIGRPKVDRLARIADLADRGATIQEAAEALGIKRRILWTYCTGRGRTDLLDRLALNAPDPAQCGSCGRWFTDARSEGLHRATCARRPTPNSSPGPASTPGPGERPERTTP